MRHDHDASAALLEQVNQALNERTPLRIQGSNSKNMLGRPVTGEVLDTRSHRGIVSYDPTELVLTARAGTPLVDIEAALDAAGQMLPFEPPHFGPGATLGGMVAAGLSGPRRPWAGSVRDYVLGTRVITGHGKLLRFGGEVMKNVAGYDLSRLMAGSFGCLGVLTEVSLKVLPKPRKCQSLRLEMDLHQPWASWPNGASNRYRSVQPPTTGMPCTCAWKAAKARWPPRSSVWEVRTSMVVIGLTCVSNAWAFSRPLNRCGAFRCHTTARRSNCQAGSCWTGGAHSAG